MLAAYGFDGGVKPAIRNQVSGRKAFSRAKGSGERTLCTGVVFIDRNANLGIRLICAIPDRFVDGGKNCACAVPRFRRCLGGMDKTLKAEEALLLHQRHAFASFRLVCTGGGYPSLRGNGIFERRSV